MRGSEVALSALRRRRLAALCGNTWRRLRGGELSAARVAFSIGVGVFIGCQPLYGLHLFLCLLVCVPLRLDTVVGYLGANISNPFVAPALVTLELEVGSLLLTGEHLTQTFEGDVSALLPELLAQAVTGSLVVGAVLAAGLGGSAFAVTAAFTRRDRRDSPVRRVIARYRGAQLKERLYVAIKLRSDPLVRELSTLQGPLGEVFDVGCGRGQFTLLLWELGVTGSASGIDWDERKIRVARGAAREQFEFRAEDATHGSWPACDTLLLIDVLHYLPQAEQRALLQKAAASVREGGRILIREIDRSSSLAAWGRASERVAAGTGFNRAAELDFSSLRHLQGELSSLGFACEIRSERRGPFFLPNALLIATRG